MLGSVLVVTACHVNVHAAPVAVTLSLGLAVVSVTPPTIRVDSHSEWILQLPASHLDLDSAGSGTNAWSKNS